MKKVLNFGQHFLETCHGNRPRSGVDLHQYHIERPPHQKKSQKNVDVARSPSSPLKSHFFRAARRCREAPRSAEDFFVFWVAFALVIMKFSAVFSHGTAASSCIEIGQCTQTHHAHTLLEALLPLPMPPWPSRVCHSTEKIAAVSRR